MHLPHQRGPLHDLPDTPEAYDAVLADVTEQALARMTPEGNLEHPDCVDDIGDTSEQAAFALALDPRGYGNPDEGWRHLVASSALEAEPAPGAPEDLHVFAVRYGPGDEEFTPAFESEGTALTVRTEAFTAVIGEAAGDANAEPELTLSCGTDA
ncbi:hypothetical protein [Streptomyces coeruleorubidus]|uniref:hypothetical protein n=1 Tax=Streptomyces coeruleorubidus TaxID=116188 RepID=UPI0019BD3ADE|nr:hypothetical protein GCM10010256_69200 [Streptomyces coeruleorubidus]